MKLPLPQNILPRRSLLSLTGIETLAELWAAQRHSRVPLYLFVALCFNLVVAPVVYAASGHVFSRSQAWALGILGLATIALSIYLFFVMFAPEKF